ncbi:stage 0 sporulation family protein [Agrilactobacillus fermenti]|uniref:PSP1 domain-containing protein n=1 Tax=Agrilactobacillus fermenti TaxID=2586909 RepID=UPI002E7BFA0C|nr:stage 0 sporulation family protein [Agrilactobacillus fermenti]MCD2255448.1 stage 0 sporulation family protein [Agrilactobacillus fermenti]
MNLFEIKFSGDATHKVCVADAHYPVNEFVIVRYGRVQIIAQVTAVMAENMMAADVPVNALNIEHAATAAELQLNQENQKAAAAALVIARQKAQQHHLKMKLIEAEYSLDKEKLIFYFTADKRVDFRNLVRDLASIYRTRIELRQIGVRDEAKILGGIGPCGRQLCCSTFLGEFVPVSIKMAKNQNLSLNPTKISGLCGRLMCCLQYEDAVYEKARQTLPDYGQKVMTEQGIGRVVGLNFLADLVKVQLTDHSVPMDYTSSEVKVINS